MHVSDEESSAGRLENATLRRAVQATHRDAFVVLDALLESDAVEEARAVVERVLARKNKHSVALPYEWLHRAPFDSFAAHPIVRQVVTAILGPGCAPEGFRWIRRCPPGRAAVASVHRDVAGFSDGELPVQLAVDIMLSAFTEDNGATEIWPGTQLTGEADVDQMKSIGVRAAKLPSVRITGAAGSVVIRDQRAWHRSGVNDTARDRLMLSMGHWRRSAPDIASNGAARAQQR